jgi:outer membrane receptor for ferrienterochelin and colicins
MKIKFLMLLMSLVVMSISAQYQYVPEDTSENNMQHRQRMRGSANITGHAVDKLTNEHLGFITIRLKGTTYGTATDVSGHYNLQHLPIDEYTVYASAVGYKTAEKQVKLERGKSEVVNFEMEEDAIMLDNIVVSANRNETKRREASNIVNVVTGKLFDNTNSVCLAQGLNFQPGLRVENNCQNCGFQQVRINGLEGPYSQILIDSRPIFSALAGVYGIEQIPVNMIDRVEVVRGGGSALFGSNAIAGTINIITKEPMNNSLSISNSTMFIAGSSADINTTVNAALVSEDYQSGVSIYGSTRQREAWDANGDGYSEIGLINARNVGFRSYFKTSSQSKLTLEYHNLGEFRRGGNKLGLPAHQADITEQTDHNINTGGMKWDFFTSDYKHRFNVFSSAQKIKRDSYYGAGMDPNAYGLTNDLSFVAGAQYAYSMKRLLFMPADFTIGAEYNYNILTDEQFAYERQIDQEMNIQSLFLQNEWKNTKLSFLLGMRLDKHNLISQPIFSPRINLRYNPQEWINLRVSYAGGFRAPQAFDEDLHLTAVGGVMQIIELDPHLKPENSRSYSISADLYRKFGRVQTNLLIEGFFTDIDDVFYLEEAGVDTTGNTILMRKNGSGARVMGVNIEGKLITGVKFNLQGGFTFQQSLYKAPQTWSGNTNLAARKEMFRSPNQYGYLTASYNPLKALTIALSGTYTGTMLLKHYGVDEFADEEVWSPEFFDAGIKFAYDFTLNKSSKLQLNAGVQNIFNSFQEDFDTGETRDAGYMYGPSLPRSFYAGLKLNL